MSQNNGLPTGRHTLIEEGTELKGAVSSSCPIVVVGKIEGEVSGPEIHVAATGVVAGKVNVKELRSQGELAGDVQADVVQISGRVRDQTVIRARTLQVTLSTEKGMEVVFGDCELAIGDLPDKAAAIAAAVQSEAKPTEHVAPSPASVEPAPVEPAPVEAASNPASTATVTDDTTSVRGEDDKPRRRRPETQSPPPA